MLVLFSASWVRGKYAEHRMNMLEERQRAMLPGDQAAAEARARERRREALEKHLQRTELAEAALCRKQIKELRAAWEPTKARVVYRNEKGYAEDHARVLAAKAHNAPITAEIRRLEKKAAEHERAAAEQRGAFFAAERVEEEPRGDDGDTGNASAPAPQKQTTMFPCPQSDCNAFVVSAARDARTEKSTACCRVCKTQVCLLCRECVVVVADAADAPPPPHACNPDVVASVKALARDTKPCPRCAVPIFKVSGCPQMMCTSCHTIFSWDTLKIQVGGVVHNPHYYEWRQRQRAAAAAAGGGADGGGAGAAGGDDACGDDGIDDARLNHLAGTEEFGDFVMRIRHISDVRLAEVNGTGDDFRELRIRFLAGELSVREWKLRLLRAERLAEWRAANAMLLTTFVRVVKDILVFHAVGVIGCSDPQQLRTARRDRVLRDIRAIAETLSAEAGAQAAAFQRHPKQRLRFVVEATAAFGYRPARLELDVATEDRLLHPDRAGVFWRT
jgi:hypothetical protein